MEVKVSNKYTLNKEDIISLGKGLLIAVAGAALTYLSENLGKINFGEYTPVVVALFSVLANIIRKFVSTQSYLK